MTGKNALTLPITFLVLISLTACPLPAGGEESISADTNWPHWRGPGTTGGAPSGDPPVEWSESKNVKWKIEIPGAGHASPVVWNDRVFILTAVPTDKRGKPPADAEPTGRRRRRGPPSVKTDKIYKFVILAVERSGGKILWQKTLREELPHERTHADGSWAASSPVTDGKRVYAFFCSRGLYCLDMNGKLKWQKDFGKMSIRMQFGEGSSPALHGDKIVINWDHEGQSFITALDKTSGKEVWKVKRDERTSWSTPLVVEVNGKAQVITSATNRIRSYDLASGELIWQCRGMTGNVIPTPVYADDIVYLASGFRGNALLAIRLSAAKGDITGSDAVIWKYGKYTPYAPSPLLQSGNLYMLKRNNGYLSCLQAATGKVHYANQKLEGIGTVYASLVGAPKGQASGRLYVVGKNGTTLVIKQGPKYEVMATNVLKDNFTASAAIAGKELYLRGHKYLYCIARK